MASSCLYTMLLHLMVMMLCTIHTTSSTGTEPGTCELIEKICCQMEEFGFCNKTFNKNLESPPANIVDLTRITIERAVINAINTHNFILQLLKNATSAVEKNALTECENAYSIVLKFYQNARVALIGKDYDGTMRDERATPGIEASCEITFRTPPSPMNSLLDGNRQMRILICHGFGYWEYPCHSPP